MMDNGKLDAVDQKDIDMKGMTPFTRRLIILSLMVISLACIGAEVVLAVLGSDGSDALLTIAAGAAGGIGGLASPSHNED